MNTKIFVYIEHHEGMIQDVSLELLNKAQILKSSRPNLNCSVTAIFINNQVSKLEEEPLFYGADHVITYYNEKCHGYNTRNKALILTKIAQEFKPDIFLFGGTIEGRDLAPRVSASLKTGLTADATSIVFNEEDDTSDTLWITRPAFGGNLFATIVCENHKPQMATIRPSIFTKQERNEEVIKSITNYDKKLILLNDVKIVQTIEKEQPKTDITKANLILSAGRGIKHHLDKARTVASLLNGELATSRALVDEGYSTKDVQVGQTGKTVRPTVYLACGISGAVQHTAGMQNSELIIAINTDKNAQIFDIADIGIVAKAEDVFDEITKQLMKKN